METTPSFLFCFVFRPAPNCSSSFSSRRAPYCIMTTASPVRRKISNPDTETMQTKAVFLFIFNSINYHVRQCNDNIFFVCACRWWWLWVLLATVRRRSSNACAALPMPPTCYDGAPMPWYQPKPSYYPRSAISQTPPKHDRAMA
jgi:hypothetical protein